MPARIQTDDKKIISMYVDGGFSFNEISKKMGVSYSTIERRIAQSCVIARDPAEARWQRDGKPIGKWTYRNRYWLNHQYTDLNKTQNQIANEQGVMIHTIRKWMHKNNIAVRSVSEAAALNANHIDVTEHLRNFLDGLLLGDGFLFCNNNISATYRHSDKHKNYIEYLKQQLKYFNVVSSENTWVKTGYTKGHKYTCYQMSTISYADFLPLRKRWYPDGKKIVPRDIILTPSVCLNWYIGDGSLMRNARGRTRIKLCTDGFPKSDVLFLIEKLRNLGIEASYWKSCNRIGISANYTKKFIDYIGACPGEIYKDYGYKWLMNTTMKEFMEENGS